MQTTKKGRRFFFHWQNLKEDYPKKLLYGRAWLHVYDRGEMNLEWSIPTSLCHLKVKVEWGKLSLSIACWLFGLWFTVDGIPWLRPETYEGREVGMSYFMHSLHWRLWADPDSWSKGTPKWRDGHFDIPDFLFGCNTSSIVYQEPIPAVVPMPEGDYPVTVKFFTQTWKRPRWPIAKVHQGAEVDSEKGIPFPGKGENSWDCGDDAYMSIGTSATTVEEAIQYAIKSVNKRRERYGGKNWQPAQV